MIDVDCGPTGDIRKFQLTLPAEKFRLGVFVSGGIDSAILYYMMCKVNRESGNLYTIIPYTMMRKEGSRLFAEPVIKYISGLFNIVADLTIVGNNTLPEDEQIKSGIQQVIRSNLVDIAYVGVIHQLPIHMVGWVPIPTKQNKVFKTPLIGLNKSHVIDLVYKLGQEHLLTITHSCIFESGRCGKCNGCNERSWAFNKLNIKDIGTI